MFMTIMIKTDVYHVLETIFISIYILIKKICLSSKQTKKTHVLSFVYIGGIVMIEILAFVVIISLVFVVDEKNHL